ncbi:MAG: DUF4892 domain-containing protein [Gammaproteobacteria bacterium]|nr:DUF4892 domain-containing protein [Gammaproteobacteria bacterium]
MKYIVATVAGISLIALQAVVLAADVQGSEDYPNIGRFKGSEIVDYKVENYGKTVFATGPVKKDSDAEKTALTVEGKITRIFYRVPKGISALEVFRNFEVRIKEANYEMIFSGGPDKINDYVFKYKHPVDIVKEAALGSGFHYFVAAKDVSGAKNYISVLVAPHGGGNGMRVGLIAAETKAMEMQMVDAKKMQMSMAETGRVALYGIYFDYNSATIKPNSKPTLGEIAKLLKSQPSLKIIVVGHTDYVGGYDYNMSLSKRRAKAVMNALVSDYKIAATRLKSDGVGYLAPAATNLTDAGRTLNRRVELVQDKD